MEKQNYASGTGKIEQGDIVADYEEFLFRNVTIETGEHAAVIDFCRKNAVDLVVVGPEAPLAMGIADDLAEAGIKVFGPKYESARLESSKIFAKEVMGGFGIPTAAFRVFGVQEP